MKTQTFIKYFLLFFPVIGFCQIGNVGINTANPTEKLHVKSTMRFEPTDAAFPAQTGYTLVSDANGNATWRNISLTKSSYFPVYNTTAYSKTQTYSANTGGTQGSRYRSTDTSITLPKGKWLILVSLGAHIQMKKSTETNFYSLPDGKSVWMRATLSDNNTDDLTGSATVTPDIVTSARFSSNAIVGPNTNGLITGEFFINQQQDAPKTYYLKYNVEVYAPEATQVKIDNFGITPQIMPENYIIAYPLVF